MENPNSNEKCNKAWIEDNMLLTMFDSSSEINQEYALDQSIAFFDAVRASSIGLQNGKPQTSKIFGAVFHMLRTGNSIQLIVASYKLLVDLESYVMFKALLSLFIFTDDSLLWSNSQPKLVVTEEAWCPLIVGAENATGVGEAGDKQSGGRLDPSVTDVYLAGTVMLIFGMGLYGLFISNTPSDVSTSVDCALKGSHLFGMFALKEWPKWMKISSLG
ncbi:negative regulator of systemic acquired resistance SNI1 [Trifolium repens]|nr:negative regulator of systemic acquired resistance SNI1 [Trifolium repens]